MYTKDADFVQETANFEFFVASVNRLKPQFVVITGDLTNKAADADQIAEFHRIAGKLAPGIKLYNVAGNHDVRNDPTAQSLAQ
jgi:3',5'-cyclic AMP phosphodiesterase CpdA